jgi:7-cyano-7-deazaguanine reductase
MFQEFIINRIMNQLKKVLKPRWIRVTGRFKPRGGISITPVAEWGSK